MQKQLLMPPTLPLSELIYTDWAILLWTPAFKSLSDYCLDSVAAAVSRPWRPEWVAASPRTFYSDHQSPSPSPRRCSSGESASHRSSGTLTASGETKRELINPRNLSILYTHKFKVSVHEISLVLGWFLLACLDVHHVIRGLVQELLHSHCICGRYLI